MKNTNCFISRSLFSLSAIFAIHAMVILFTAGTVTAAGESGLTPVRIEEAKAPTAALQGIAPVDPGENARSQMLALKVKMGLSADDDFAVRTVHHGTDGRDHVRLTQKYQGIPVWGGEVAVHKDAEGRVLFLEGNILKVPTGTDISPKIGDSTALGISLANYASVLPAKAQARLTYARESAELGIFDGPNGPTLAWRVEFFTEMQEGLPPGCWNYFIDAGTGAILKSYNSLSSALPENGAGGSPVFKQSQTNQSNATPVTINSIAPLQAVFEASGPGGNPNISRTWVNQLDVESTTTPGVYIMDTARFQTIDVNTGLSPTGPLDPISSDPGINDAHGFTKIVLDMMQIWFGHNSIDDNGYKIISNYNSGYGGGLDATWTGTTVEYGNGVSPALGRMFYPFSGGIDIVGHEISEGFTQFHSSLGPIGMTGALLESFADITGTLAEFYSSPATANFNFGEAIVIPGVSRGVVGNALRYMCDPILDGNSIADAIVFNAVADKHFNNGVINKAFCRAARRLSSGSPTGASTQAGVQRAGAAWFEANAHYWVSSTDFTQGCQGIQDAAAALGFSATELAALRDSWADVGIFCGGGVRPCDETLTTATGTIQSPNFPNNYLDNYTHTWCIQPSSGAATLTFSAFNIDNGFDFVEVRDAANNLLSRSTGTTTPATASSSLIRVTFGTDPAFEGPGWQASWTSVATPPVANNDSFSTAKDTPMNVAAPGVLANDTAFQGSLLVANLVTGPAHAQTFALSPNGSFTYLPATGYTGTDSFTYKANDGINDSILAATVTINTGFPEAPTIASARFGNTQATVTFTAPASDGGSAITGYTVVSSPAGGIDSNAGTTALGHTVTNLTNGVPYTFTVTATNAVGPGIPSTPSVSVTPGVVHISGFDTLGYQTLQAGYNAAPNGAEIQLTGAASVGALTVTQPGTVSINGGFDSAFLANSGSATILGEVILQMGTTSFQNVIIQ